MDGSLMDQSLNESLPVGEVTETATPEPAEKKKVKVSVQKVKVTRGEILVLYYCV